ncbi:MAG: hypothetical protein MOGMAGMI_02343 [Candidatus Omnitrophica bacterium]|nr:hypothetical protein [Candidatus Omnitrophota bacterium]
MSIIDRFRKKKPTNGFEGIPKPMDPVEFGKWIIEFNPPFGFLVKNTKTPEEYHFFGDSDGWVTSRHGQPGKQAALAYSTRSLLTGTFYPQATCFVDKESTKKATRIMELQAKKHLTQDETAELLDLTGVKPLKK